MEVNLLEYQFQESKKDERIIVLKETGLIYKSSITGESLIPYHQIKKINLFSPMKNVYACKIITHGRKKILLANRSYKSFENLEFQNTEYNAFVKELHRRLKDVHGIEFSSGSSLLYYFCLITIPLIFILLIFILLILMLFISSSSGKNLPISPFVGLLIVIPLAVYYLKKSKKQIYNPDNILIKFLHLLLNSYC